MKYILRIDKDNNNRPIIIKKSFIVEILDELYKLFGNDILKGNTWKFLDFKKVRVKDCTLRLEQKEI